MKIDIYIEYLMSYSYEIIYTINLNCIHVLTLSNMYDFIVCGKNEVSELRIFGPVFECVCVFFYYKFNRQQTKILVTTYKIILTH